MNAVKAARIKVGNCEKKVGKFSDRKGKAFCENIPIQHLSSHSLLMVVRLIL